MQRLQDRHSHYSNTHRRAARYTTTPKIGVRENKTTQPQYAPKLWSTVEPTHQQPSMRLVDQVLQSPNPIYLVSNASLNNQKRGAFSWMIATMTQELWNGSGMVPGPQCNAHSGQTEGYGLLAGFTFLEHYLIQTQVTNDQMRATIQAYCDNSGLIQQITKMQNSQIPNPNWSTMTSI